MFCIRLIFSKNCFYYLCSLLPLIIDVLCYPSLQMFYVTPHYRCSMLPLTTDVLCYHSLQMFYVTPHFRLIAKEMIAVHKVRPPGMEVKNMFWVKIHQFLELGPEKFEDPKTQEKYLHVLRNGVPCGLYLTLIYHIFV